MRTLSVLVTAALLLGGCGSLYWLTPVGADPQVRVEGDDVCRGQTYNALKALKDRAPSDYTAVVENVGVVECREKGSHVTPRTDPPRVVAGKATRDRGLTWYASVLRHEAVHVEQYRGFIKKNPSITLVPRVVYADKDAELSALDVQIEVLRLLGADKDTIQYVEGAKSSSWWTTPLKDQWW